MSDDRTEKPTSRRLKDAAKRGQVARSRDLNDAFHLGAALMVLAYWGPSLVSGMGTVMATGLTRMGDARSVSITSGEVVNLAVSSVTQIGWLVGPLALAALVATAASAQAQGGLNIATEALRIDLTRLNPAAGFKRLMPSQAGLNLVKTIIAASIVGTVAWSAVSGLLADSTRFALLDPLASGIGAWAHTVAFLKRASIALLALAAADFGLQKWRTAQSLKMTKQEVRDDHKLAEGNPEIKARVRRVQREMFRKRMLAAVPKATVVVTNPTHFAVALRYTRGQAAPEVVAKGADNIALKIRTIAREHGVPIVENPPLARAIYRQVDVGEFIPGDLFEAVAEVLAYLIRLKQLVL
ncbi:Flagellar biosynthetic protein FlhB [Luteitalea pratensis]|uniref:Flagellar biosynthetic protein FlhB n=1 Tax=Luteitalea pratensis TaxID=1855912 RepID=A0A143PRH8_LUTPR|nr:EscU/YscU/HrcU family type III secretion system export apparatus switch protein [Luteitalea pratensis]AMY10424.1 Flagellar biosynthetic protein FlhB [Luteitalea pratensis]